MNPTKKRVRSNVKTSEVNNYFVDVVRECLGLDPLYRKGRPGPDVERFGGAIHHE